MIDFVTNNNLGVLKYVYIILCVPEFLEEGQDSAGVQVMCDGSTAGHQTGPDVRFYRQTSLDGFLRQ